MVQLHCLRRASILFNQPSTWFETVPVSPLTSAIRPRALPERLPYPAGCAACMGLLKPACGSEIHASEINKATLHYFECGEGGEPFVFVLGGPGGLHTFQAQVQTFATRFRVIADSRCFSPCPTPRHERQTSILYASRSAAFLAST